MSTLGKIIHATQSGYIKGWADADLDRNQTIVSIVTEGKIIGSAIANDYSSQVMDHGAPHAWCAFNMRMSSSMIGKTGQLILIDQHTRKQIDAVKSIEITPDIDEPISSINDLISSDPTILASIDQIHTIEPILNRYVNREGIERFIKTAYVYILGRPADDGGLAGYAQQLNNANMKYVALLQDLASSAEYASRPRQLQSPASVGFPFK